MIGQQILYQWKQFLECSGCREQGAFLCREMNSDLPLKVLGDLRLPRGQIDVAYGRRAI